MDSDGSSAARLQSSILVGSNQAHPIFVPFSQGIIASGPEVSSENVVSSYSSDFIINSSKLGSSSNIFGLINQSIIYHKQCPLRRRCIKVKPRIFKHTWLSGSLDFCSCKIEVWLRCIFTLRRNNIESNFNTAPKHQEH